MKLSIKLSRGYRAFALFLGLLVISPNSFGIVNVEDMRVRKKENGFSGQLDLDIDLKSGNSNLQRYGVGTRLQWIKGKRTNFVVLNHAYGESGGVRDVNKSFLHGRHVVQRNARWAWESFAQLEQNEFRRLSFRGLVGGGVRRTLREKADRGAMYLGLGGFYSSERLDDNTVTNLFRVSTYFVAKHSFSPTTHFVSTTYFQPATSDFGDYRVLEDMAFDVAINKHVSLKLSLQISHDSQPPAGVQPTDTGFSTGIDYRF